MRWGRDLHGYHNEDISLTEVTACAWGDQIDAYMCRRPYIDSSVSCIDSLQIAICIKTQNIATMHDLINTSPTPFSAWE